MLLRRWTDIPFPGTNQPFDRLGQAGFGHLSDASSRIFAIYRSGRDPRVRCSRSKWGMEYVFVCGGSTLLLLSTNVHAHSFLFPPLIFPAFPFFCSTPNPPLPPFTLSSHSPVLLSLLRSAKWTITVLTRTTPPLDTPSSNLAVLPYHLDNPLTGNAIPTTGTVKSQQRTRISKSTYLLANFCPLFPLILFFQAPPPFEACHRSFRALMSVKVFVSSGSHTFKASNFQLLQVLLSDPPQLREVGPSPV